MSGPGPSPRCRSRWDQESVDGEGPQQRSGHLAGRDALDRSADEGGDPVHGELRGQREQQDARVGVEGITLSQREQDEYWPEDVDRVARTQRGEGAQAAARTTAAAAPAPPSPRSPAAGGANDQAKPNAAPTLAQGIEAVKAEGLTGRQLRLARRIAAMHGIDVESEHEAVVILRERGIDPFHRDSMSLVIAKAGERAKGADTPKPGNNLALRPEAGTPSNMRPFSQIAPMKMPPKPSLPPREALTEDKRAADEMPDGGTHLGPALGRTDEFAEKGAHRVAGEELGQDEQRDAPVKGDLDGGVAGRGYRGAGGGWRRMAHGWPRATG